MTDPFALPAILVPAPTVITPVSPAPLQQIELITPLPAAMQAATTFTATVVARSVDGALLLRTALGMLSVRTNLPLPAGSRIELDLQPGQPPTLTILGVTEAPDSSETPAPPMQLDLNTTVEATVRGPPPAGGSAALPVGTHLLLRVASPPAEPTLQAASPLSSSAPSSSPPTATTVSAPASGPPPPDPATARALIGQVAVAAGGETVVETPVGVLSLDLRLALAPGTTIAFERLEATPPSTIIEPPPSQAGGWPALDQALAFLERAAPSLAQQMQRELTPGTPGALAGTLLFLMGALYRGGWPGNAFNSALTAAGHDKLRAHLGEDLAELQKLRDDPATGEWRVHVLPLLAGTMVQPLRLYLRRRGTAPQDQAGDGSRFVIEAELSRLGPMQLDGLVRGQRLDLVLRSHIPLAVEMREETTAIFRQATSAAGLHGDLVFATSARFAVAPMAKVSERVEVRA